MFDTIRSLTCDARVISRNTDYPQYKIQQIKDKLFMAPKSQNDRVCDWWLRLYQGTYIKKDLELLALAMEGKYYWVNDMEEVWCAEIDDDPSDREYM